MTERGAEYLMVEDNLRDAEIALFNFEEHGIANNFHIARSGDEALDYLFTEDGSLRSNLRRPYFSIYICRRLVGLNFCTESSPMSKQEESRLWC